MSDIITINPEHITIVGYDTEDGEEHPLWDARASWPVDPDLVFSLKERGLLQPVRVIEQDGKYFAEAGRQRIKAARRAKLSAVACVVVKDAIDENATVRAAIENAQRRGNSPIEKARVAKRLVDLGHDRKEIKRVFGLKSEVALSHWLTTINTASDELLKLVDDGEVPFTVAYHLCRAPEPELALTWWLDHETGKLTVAKAKRTLESAHIPDENGDADKKEKKEKGDKKEKKEKGDGDDGDDTRGAKLTAGMAVKLAKELEAFACSAEGRKDARGFASAMAWGLALMTGEYLPSDVDEMPVAAREYVGKYLPVFKVDAG